MRSRWKERQRQAREEAILEAAHGLLMERGYAAMNMDDLAGALGISKATLYQHVASKEELVVRVVERVLQQAEAYVRAQPPEAPAIQRLRHVLRYALEQRTRFGAGRALELPPWVHDDPRCRAQVARLRAALAELVDAAKAEGAIEARFATAVIVSLLVSVMRESNYADLLAAGLCSPQELSQAVTDMVLWGICRRRASAERAPHGEPTEDV